MAPPSPVRYSTSIWIWASAGDAEPISNPDTTAIHSPASSVSIPPINHDESSTTIREEQRFGLTIINIHFVLGDNPLLLWLHPGEAVVNNLKFPRRRLHPQCGHDDTSYESCFLDAFSNNFNPT